MSCRAQAVFALQMTNCKSQRLSKANLYMGVDYSILRASETCRRIYKLRNSASAAPLQGPAVDCFLTWKHRVLGRGLGCSMSSRCMQDIGSRPQPITEPLYEAGKLKSPLSISTAR